MTTWGDIVRASERFPPVGRRHGLQLVTDLVRTTDEREPVLAVELHSDDLRLVMRRSLPAVEGADWIAALVELLDVEEGELPHPDAWAGMVDAFSEHRRALDDLPVLEDDAR